MATIREVADRPGVSATTVSHVLNQTRFVSAPIRGRVLQAMHELGYRPNALARSLRRGETKTLGLVLPDSANPFFAELGREIEFAAFRLLQRDPLQHGGRPGQGAPTWTGWRRSRSTAPPHRHRGPPRIGRSRPPAQAPRGDRDS